MHRSLWIGVIAAAHIALANGASVTVIEDGAATGTLRPKVQTHIALTEERLRISLSDPSESYEVKAEYSLRNAAGPTKITYGVPVYEPNSYWFDAEGSEDLRLSTGSETLLKSIRVQLGERALPCTLSRREAIPELLPAVLQPSALLTPSSAGRFVGFCTVELEVPSGDVKLQLSYRGELFSTVFSGGPSSEQEAHQEELVRCKTKACQRELATLRAQMDEQSRPRSSVRVLHYPFAGAGTWGGKRAPLDAEIDLTGYRVLSGLPKGSKATSKGVSWKGLVSAESPDLELVLAPRGGPRPSDGPSRGWSLLAAKSSRASSTLPAEGKHQYGPEMAVDGDPATAWCTKSDRGGVGEWIELDFAAVRDAWVTWGVATGLTRNEKTWKSNARPTSLRLSECDGGSPLATLDLSAAKDFENAGVTVLPASGGSPFEGSCVRFEVTAVAAGEKYPEFCISELSGAKRDSRR